MTNKDLFAHDRYRLTEIMKVSNWLQEHPNDKEMTRIQKLKHEAKDTPLEKAPNPRRDY